MVDLCALYKPDLKGPGDKVAWIEKKTTAPSGLALIRSSAAGFRASRRLIQAMY
jgi:hypothetical protein